jgi:hypothetical protein
MTLLTIIIVFYVIYKFLRWLLRELMEAGNKDSFTPYF